MTTAEMRECAEGEAYKDDHAFVDGSVRPCDCMGH